MDWFSHIIVWYLYLFALGLLFFPVAVKVFGSFFDRGYAFSKTIAIGVLSYAVFVLGVLHVLPFTKEGLFLVLLVSGFLIHRWCKPEIKKIRELKRQELLRIVGIELLFFLGLLFLAVVRGHEPSIHGLEKFMDFGFMQSIGKSTYFPPTDMWLSADELNPNGYAINYYYFGHLTGALLIKLTGTNPFIGYNLILATILAQGLTTVFSLTASIVMSLQKKLKQHASALAPTVIGALGAFIVNFGGNLHTIYILTTGYPNEEPTPFWGIMQTPSKVYETMTTTGKNVFDSLVANASYWYPNATRFIPFTIHEFPSYSYVVADLHGHVFDIPFVILTLALVWVMYEHVCEINHTTRFSLARLFREIQEMKYEIFRHMHRGIRRLHLTRKEMSYSILIGSLIAINYMTNAFDGPIYLLFLIGLFFFMYRWTVEYFIQLFIVFTTFVVVSLPFSFFFDPFAKLIGVNCSPAFLVAQKAIGPFLFEKGNCQISAPYMVFILWGFFWIAAILFVLSLIKSHAFKTKKVTSTDWFLLMIFGFSTFLIIIPEFFYIKDIYPGHFRANTMFKLGYQAFMMMGVASAIVFYRIGLWKSKKKYILQGIYIFFFMFVFIYPFLAFPSFYPDLTAGKFFTTVPQLDGSIWMKTMYPQDKELIDYINARISGQPVILEAQGDSYTDYDRISAYTGNPTVAGWWVHQWLWRGSSDVVGERIPDVEALYQSKDVDLTKQLIRKYRIEYVVVSTLERDRYKEINEDKFTKIGTKIFESSNGSGALYKVY